MSKVKSIPPTEDITLDVVPSLNVSVPLRLIVRVFSFGVSFFNRIENGSASDGLTLTMTSPALVSTDI